MKKIILLVTICQCCFQFNYSQSAKLDSSFGINGIVIENLDQGIINSSDGRQAFTQSDGSFYILFESKGYAFITKRDINGAADKSYGKNGFSQRVKASPAKAAPQADGKIVVAGSASGYLSDFVVFRLNTSGSLDSTFGTNGIQVTDFASGNDAATAVAIQTDGKIVVVGSSDGWPTPFIIVRYNLNGTLDTTFDKDGIQSMNLGIARVAIQNDGKIVVAGSTTVLKNGSSYHDAVVARLKPNGTFDSTFSSDGKQTTGLSDKDGNPLNFFGDAVVIQPNGKIVIAGGDGLARYNNDGTLDNTFSGDGKLTKIFGSFSVNANSMVLQQDGKIVVGGNGFGGKSADFFTARCNINGSIDPGFSADGVQITDFNARYDYASSLAVEPDGKILIAGTDGSCEGNCLNKFAVARYDADGRLDSTFDEDGKLTGGYPGGNIIYKQTAVQRDGKLVVIGDIQISGVESHSFILRYNSDGTFDKTFNGNGIKNSDFKLSALALQDDGKIIVAGFSIDTNIGVFAVARYNTDGSPDNTFSDDGKQTTDFYGGDNMATSLAIQNDGKIVVAGTVFINDYNGNGDYSFAFGVARYKSNGSLDSNFSGDGKEIALFYYEFIGASCVAIQHNGEIVVAGRMNTSRSDEIAIALFSANGSLVSTRTTDVIDGNDDFASSIAIQSDDKILVAGARLFRFNPDLSPDNSFSQDGIASTGGSSILVQNDKKILLGGRNEIVRYNPDGNLDSTFDGDGIQIIKAADEGDIKINGIAIYENKLYAAGTFTNTIGYESFGSFGIVAKYLLDGNISPTISLTTPANNTTYTTYGYIKIILNANASDADGTISKIEFYSDNTLLHTEYVTPYGYMWHNVASGNYTITAKATDNNGNVTTSNAVHISIKPDIAPTVNITSPANGASYRAYSGVTLSADANDVDGTVKKVDFYNGSTLIFTETVAPFKRGGYRLPLGNYSITAKATDNNGRATTSQPVLISVLSNLAPVVSITSPADHTTYVSPATIILSADGSDADGTIKKIEFYNGSTLLFTENDAPYFRSWPDVPEGNYSITAKATDNDGKISTSAPVTISVTTASRPFVKEQKLNFSKEPLTLNLSPNPVGNTLAISVHGLQTNSRSTISVLYVSGAVIKTIQPNALNKNVQLDVSSLSGGVYFIKVINGDKILYKQFVKL